MTTIGICDDEQSMRGILRPVVERTCQLAGMEYQITEYSSGEEFIRQLDAANAPDILFLDIEMKALSGMDTARMLRSRDKKTVLIFVTAYPDFVFQGYEVHAFHYILKPYRESKIIEVLNQAFVQLSESEDQYFTVEQKSGILRLPLKQTMVFQSDKRKVRAYMQNKVIDFYGRLSEIQETLPSYFVRIHNRYLVNLNFVTAVGRDCCTCGTEQYPVSRAYKQNLEVAFAKMLLR